jgi:hypothetical protein
VICGVLLLAPRILTIHSLLCRMVLKSTNHRYVVYTDTAPYQWQISIIKRIAGRSISSMPWGCMRLCCDLDCKPTRSFQVFDSIYTAHATEQRQLVIHWCVSSPETVVQSTVTC